MLELTLQPEECLTISDSIVVQFSKFGFIRLTSRFEIFVPYREVDRCAHSGILSGISHQCRNKDVPVRRSSYQLGSFYERKSVK